jgi:spermidine synthase
VKLAAMKPYTNLGESKMADGTVFSLHKHDGNFYLKYNGFELMSTALTYSEQMLSEIGCADILEGVASRPAHPKVLIGGLGLGFTLKRALELVGSPATVEVAELMPPIIEWNRTFLVEHNGPLLEDPRTKITQGDFFDILNSKPKGSYDALLLDIDNSPDDLITEGNDKMYSPSFLAKIKGVLTPNGCVTYWLAVPAPKFKRLLEKTGFEVEAHAAKPHEQSKKSRHCIYLARKR